MDGDLDGFRQEFESFLDQCPSFLHYVNAGRFLPVFFFSMFATAHDAGILNTDEKVYFRFDNHGIDTGGRNRNTGNLKVAVYRDGQQVVRCYSISDRPNSDGLRFSTRERDSLVQEIIRQNPNLREEDLNFEQYKVCMHGKGKSQGEAIATVFEVIREKDSQGRDRFAKYSASEISLLRHIERNRLRGINAPAPRSVLTVKEIGSIRLNQDQRVQLGHLVNFVQVAPGQQGIFNFMEVLASNQRINVERGINEGILPYITRIYRNYLGSLQNDIQNRNQKFESHGFFLGLLANFSHLYTIDIDLDLSPGNSYVAFLVRHQAERENIPIVINVTRWRTSSDIALNRARGDAKRLHASSFISIHTESRNAVCIGLNFNLNIDPFSVDTVEFLENRFPLVQRLFEYIEDEEVGENIRDFLLQHLPGEIPRNAENYNRIFDCITGFAFGSSAFDNGYIPIQRNGKRSRLQATKHIFRYDDPDLRRCLTMVFHVQGLPIVILDVRAYNVQQQGAINLENLNINGNNVHVWEVSCILNDQFELDIDQPNDLGLYHDYQNANNFLAGDLIQVPNAENVHNALNQVMNNGWQNRDQHRVLLMAISRVLMPENMNGDAIIDVDSNDKFRSMLHGVFYASDDPDKVFAIYKVGQTYSLKRGQEEEGERVILTRITEQRLDLLLLRQPTADTHPIVYVLGFADNAEEVAQKENNAKDRIKELMNKQRGYLPITPGNEVVLSSAVFNAGAGRVEGLISIPEGIGREEYVHRLDRGGRDSRPGILVGPESVIDENPPEELLSDITRKRLIDYFQGNQKQSSIPLLDLGNNRWVAVRYLEGNKERIIRRLRFGTDETLTAQEILHQINAILRRNNAREIEDVHNLLALDFATENQNFRYWLQTHDMFFAARQYTFHDDRSNPTNDRHDFAITSVGVDENQNDLTGRGLLSSHIDNFKQKVDSDEKDRLIAIINVGNRHWVTLVIVHQNGNYYGYYADSLGPDSGIDNNIRGALRECDINDDNVHNVSVHQQTDDHNCGIWAYENARDINQAIDQALQGNNNFGEKGEGIIGYIHGLLSAGIGNDARQSQRNEQYFKNRRRNISQLFQNDPLSSPRGRLIQDHPGIQHEIDPLLLQFLELQYPQRGGGGALQLGGERVISIDFGPQSALDEIDGVNRVYDCSNGRGSR
ncbi:C48 family peptidase [Wolbachia endosymbiont of Aedes albopictus]|nr:C48 family peptidase [Wolbachia endosymbiont of Aedes albopictus]UVW84458.1 C48 family peptidase [Wolbachia endosymbiont of Aedes albopictus]